MRVAGLSEALNAPPWLLPDRFLPVLVANLPMIPAHLDPRGPPDAEVGARGRRARLTAWLRTLKHVHRAAGGRTRLRRTVRLSW